MTTHNTRYVQSLADDPYLHSKTQQQTYLGSTGQETAGDAIKLITQGKVVHNLWQDGTWHVDLNNGDGAQIITVAYYTPIIRVRAIKIFSDSATLFNRIAYDTPQSTHVVDDFATGVFHSIWITRLHLNDCDTGIRVSLIG